MKKNRPYPTVGESIGSFKEWKEKDPASFWTVIIIMVSALILSLVNNL